MILVKRSPTIMMAGLCLMVNLVCTFLLLLLLTETVLRNDKRCHHLPVKMTDPAPTVETDPSLALMITRRSYDEFHYVFFYISF